MSGGKTVNVFLGICIYVMVMLAVALIFGALFRRQDERRDPFIVCRDCASRDECHIPADITVCPSVEVEDRVREVLNGIPNFDL